ncbi:outer membrane porin GjpA [Mycobacterium sp. M1]|uniref:Outer membrane porin GjpA n=1 Tax=Mycolicibacter acidiphilus TaxID=2835306 RepID=A0ABS5RI65_9MYCO|nr:outer membrane porin GjpA [Mycolicibacter acidiphilus]MBS9533960.1 outer membrane porin GjpA [Mycolicibacter acidiphilus]
MQPLAHSPWIAAGVALVGAGAIAATPVVASTPALSGLPSHTVQLTAGLDLFGAWQDVFDTAKANATVLSDNADGASAAVGQLIADLVHGTKIDPKDVLDAIAQPSLDGSISPSPLSLSNDLQALIPLVLPGQLPDDFPLTAEQLTPILSFASSPLSGVLMGALGPSIAPMVALFNSLEDIHSALSGSTPDTAAALQDLVNIPANMVGGLLNGATIDLTGLIPTLTEAGLLPAAMDVTQLSFAFGGLLSPGYTGNDVEGFLNGVEDGSSPGIGGSIINSLGLTTGLMGFPLVMDPHGVGPIGAMESLQEIIAMALGWNGVDNPLDGLDGGL